MCQLGQVLNELTTKIGKGLTSMLSGGSLESRILAQTVLVWVTKAAIQRGLEVADSLWDFSLKLLLQQGSYICFHWGEGQRC